MSLEKDKTTIKKRCSLQTDLELNAWLRHGAEGVGLPVDLLHLLPHHHVEAGRVLVAEDEAGVVVVRHSIHVERPFEIHTAERRVTLAAIDRIPGGVSEIFLCISYE